MPAMVQDGLEKGLTPALAGELGFHAKTYVQRRFIVVSTGNLSVSTVGTEPYQVVVFIGHGVKIQIRIQKLGDIVIIPAIFQRIVEVIGRLVSPAKNIARIALFQRP